MVFAASFAIATSQSSMGQATDSAVDSDGIGSTAQVDPPAPTGQWMTPQQARLTLQSLVDMAIEKSPHDYQGNKNWGKTKKVWAGVRLRRDGLRLKTNRRWRDVRHGLQTRYQVSFPGDESSPPPMIANVRSVTYVSESANQQPSWAIECDVTTPLDFTARIQRWNLGVQWYSIEVRGHMKVRLELQGRLSAYPDYSDIPPAIVIDPHVTSASLTLQSLHIDRVSKIGGDVAEQWGEIAEEIIKEIFIDDINRKLHTKLNKAIDKNRDALRFSVIDWLTQLAQPSSQGKAN